MEVSSHIPSATSFPDVLSAFEQLASPVEIGRHAKPIESWIQCVAWKSDSEPFYSLLPLETGHPYLIRRMTEIAKRDLDDIRTKGLITETVHTALRDSPAQVALRLACLTGKHPSEDGPLPDWRWGEGAETIDPFVTAAVRAAAYDVLPSAEQRAQFDVARVRFGAFRDLRLPLESPPGQPVLPAFPSVVVALHRLGPNPFRTAKQFHGIKDWVDQVAADLASRAVRTYRPEPRASDEDYLEELTIEAHLRLRQSVCYGRVLLRVHDAINVREVVLAIAQLMGMYPSENSALPDYRPNDDGWGPIAKVAWVALLESVIIALPDEDDQIRFYEALPDDELNLAVLHGDPYALTEERGSETSTLEDYIVPIEGALPQEIDDCPICTLALEMSADDDDRPVKTRCTHFFHVGCLSS